MSTGSQNNLSCTGRLPLGGRGSARRFGFLPVIVIGGRRAKHVSASQTDQARDAATLPVLDALHAARPSVKAKLSRNRGGAAEAVDDLCVRMLVHGRH